MAWAGSTREDLEVKQTEIQCVIAELREELVVKRKERVEHLGEVLEAAITVQSFFGGTFTAIGAQCSRYGAPASNQVHFQRGGMGPTTSLAPYYP